MFAGGDCVTGPATVIRAIAAGKVAAANIDEYLGFHHEISVDVVVPDPQLSSNPPHGRINTTERQACERKNDFTCIECGMTDEEAQRRVVPLPEVRPLRLRNIQGREEEHMVNLKIDNIPVSVPEGTTILEAAQLP